MENIQVRINNDGITAEEVNPYKKQLDNTYTKGHTPSFTLLEAYRASDAMLRTFEIDKQSWTDRSEYFSKQGDYPTFLFPAGGRWQAEILPNGKIKIL